MNFFKFGTSLVAIDKVSSFIFDVNEKTGQFYCKIIWKDGVTEGSNWSHVHGIPAIDLAMRFGPEVLEGHSKFKFAKYSWAFHNLIAHPIMQILCFFGLTKWGLAIHDSTIPRPKVKNDS